MAVNKLNCIYMALRRASRRCDNYYSKLTNEYKITPTQLHILYNLFHSPGNTNKDISEIMELSRSTCLRELVLLVNKDMIFKHAKHLTSEYRHLFSLTVKGQEVMKNIFAEWKKLNLNLEKMVGIEMKEIVGMLDKIGPAHLYKYTYAWNRK